MDKELTSEEMCLLARGYKNVIQVKRESLQTLSIIEKEQISNEKDRKKIKEYKLKIEKEIADKCEEVLSLIGQHLIPSSSSPKSSVFFYKMEEDYYRYLAEIKVGENRIEITQKALKAYQTATSIAEPNLQQVNPVRLGVALNLSVLYYEVLEDCDMAYWVAKNTYDQSIVEFDKLNNIAEYKDSIVIIQVIKDNMISWEDVESEKQTNF